jgi:hypothetical protein
MRTRIAPIVLIGVVFAFEAHGADAAVTDAGRIDPTTVAKPFRSRKVYSPYANWNYPMRVYWGDTHLHTGWSADAGGFGCTLGPEEALRFARGEQVTASTGQEVRLSRPLDFAVVTDHSDGAGVIFEIKAGNPELMKDPTIARWHDMFNAGGEESTKAVSELIVAQSNKNLPPAITDSKLAASIWKKNTAIMEQYNEPGRFTAFIGYEWTSNAGGGDNLHRNVIYRDGKDKADQISPMTTFDSENPEDLWTWLETWEKTTGGKVLAIPHNGNLSNGRMFALATFLGDPLTREWAERRARWEPLYEVAQIKGTGETHPSLSPNDEFAAWELWDKGNLNLVPKQPGMLEHEYARRALQNGLVLEDQLGVNPFKFGMVASTDSHTGLSAIEENNFFGKHSGVEPSPQRWKHLVFDFEGRKLAAWEMASAGWAGVWATENTREALWDAMKRKEVYATTGPRMTVRFFGGWNFEPSDAQTRNPAEVGYTKGVPMGGDLSILPPALKDAPGKFKGLFGGKLSGLVQTALKGRKPTFLVAALKDPLAGNLDRIQIVKGWVDAEGEIQEKVYDVAWGGDRQPGPDGTLPPVGNTVDVKNATWTNTIGAPELIAVWKDVDFDPSQRAFYYARVLEIPTPRWTAYEAKRFGITMSDDVPMIGQERAYTSPIWFTPEV